MKIEIDKPVVPVWFDDWYKTFEGNKTNALYFLNRTGWGYSLTYDNECEVEDYAGKLSAFSDSDGFSEAQEYLSKAILYGYEVKSEPLYYAKVKGWEYLPPSQCFWNYIAEYGEYVVADRLHSSHQLTQLTIEEWNELGINDTNADFREV